MCRETNAPSTRLWPARPFRAFGPCRRSSHARVLTGPPASWLKPRGAAEHDVIIQLPLGRVAPTAALVAARDVLFGTHRCLHQHPKTSEESPSAPKHGRLAARRFGHAGACDLVFRERHRCGPSAVRTQTPPKSCWEFWTAAGRQTGGGIAARPG